MPDIDRTATMTSNTDPSPNVVSASDETNGAAYQSFDKADSQWIPNTSTGTIQYDFGVSPPTWAADGYTITAQAANRSPNTWTFEGSNNGSSWTTLDSQSGITFSATEKKTFAFSNIVNYRYYRIVVTANNGDALLEIDEIEILAPDSTTTSTSTSTSTTSTSSSTSTTSTSTSRTTSTSTSRTTSTSTTSTSSSTSSSTSISTSTSSSTSTTSTSSSTSSSTSISTSTSTTSTSSTTTFPYSFKVKDAYY